jgi:hypothetical protein
MRKIVLLKNDPPRIALDPGLYGGYEALRLLRLWEYAEQDPIKAFGLPWIDLPWWLQEDMFIWIEMRAWHEIDAKADSAEGLPSVETR